jgi:Xaa-Pro aminopeptidase
MIDYELLANRLNSCPLTLEERDHRWKRIREAMSARGVDCLLVHGHNLQRVCIDNITYLANISVTEGFLVFPLKEEPTLFLFIAPPSKAITDRFWVKDMRVGSPLYSKEIIKRIKELDLENASFGAVGLCAIDGTEGKMPYATYSKVIEAFPKARFQDSTDLIEEARMVKSPAEINCLEVASEIGEAVFETISETAKAGVRDGVVVARVINTLLLNGSIPGTLLLYRSGKELTHAGEGDNFAPFSLRTLEKGDIILVEFSANYFGYIAQYNQPFSVGKPDNEWQRIFDTCLRSYENGMKVLRPGITIKELNDAFVVPIEEQGYHCERPPFHGVGVGTAEPPWGSFPIQPNRRLRESYEIKANMVLEFEPQAVAPDSRRGIHLGTSVMVTETGCRQLSKSWRPEFRVI